MADKEDGVDEDVLEMKGYRESMPLKVVTWIGTVLTLGVLRFVFYLYPQWYLKATHFETTLGYAQKILVTNIYEKRRTQFISSVTILDLTTLRLRYQNHMFRDANDSNRFVDEQFESIFQDELVVYFPDGSYQVMEDCLKLTLIKNLPFVWDERMRTFRKLAGLGPGLNYQDIYHYVQYSEVQRQIMRSAYGDNTIDVPDSSFLVIFIKETFMPFYLLQFFNSILWGITGNLSYAIIMVAFTFLIILLTSAQTKWNQVKLRKTVSKENAYFKVLCGNEVQSVPSSQLVPGDRVILPHNGCKVPCDGIILNGSCIVNESMLTGESVPQIKSPLPITNQDFKESGAVNHVVYSGTIMLRCLSSEPLEILVTKTGFSTSQGSIVRSILYPRPLDFAFENSVIMFVTVIFILSLIGAIINDIIEITHKESAWKIIVNTIKIAIMLIPPIMPIMSASKLAGISRLMRRKIFCINPAAFNLAGSASCICFDKTGTLTEDGLDLYEVVPANSGTFSQSISGNSEVVPDQISDLAQAMACCHSLMSIDGQLTGDPIDVKMFEWTKWDFTSTDGDDKTIYPTVSPRDNKFLSIRTVHLNQFSSKLQRMSVVVQRTQEELLRLFCKGSPEAIVALSLPHTVPQNLKGVLDSLTRRGFRVLGLGSRLLSESSDQVLRRTTRDQLECELEFLGLIAFENKLKPETIPAIQELKNANYKIIMITGDNQQTAESVAKECGIINDHQAVIELLEEDDEIHCVITKRIAGETMSDSYAASTVSVEDGDFGEDHAFSVSGGAWKILRAVHRDSLPQVLVRAAVFARMTSDQKKEVICELRALGYGIVMCGDGANDCGALRAADVGISLSQCESSTAASFTSHVENISCVPVVIRYGRCSLSIAVSFFKFMIMSSILTIFVERFMEGMNSTMSSGELIYLAFVSYANFAVWFPRSDAYQGPLPAELPGNSVMSVPVIFSIFSNLLIYFCFQVANYFLVKQFSWYKSLGNDMSYESYAIFCTAALQIITLAVSQSSGYPFRQPIYKNILLSVVLTAILILDLLITFHPPQSITNWLKIRSPPKLDYPFTLVALIIVNLMLVMLLERLLIDKVIYKRYKHIQFLINRKSKKKYLDIQEKFQKNYNWVYNVFRYSHRRD